MRMLFLLFFICFTSKAWTQDTTAKWSRAFPITGYMVELNDSVKVVQVVMPDGTIVTEKETVFAYGVYRSGREDAVFKGYGKCNLIKGDYYYFTIRKNPGSKALQEGDIIYCTVEKTSVHEDQLIELATHYIQLLDVFDRPLYDRYDIFSNWTEADEKAVLDSMVADIQLTGHYFIKEDPTKDRPINEGKYKSKKVLTVMTECQVSDLREFLDYMIARPRLYAGNKWKISEIFATWLSKGAPIVVDN